MLASPTSTVFLTYSSSLILPSDSNSYNARRRHPLLHSRLSHTCFSSALIADDVFGSHRSRLNSMAFNRHFIHGSSGELNGELFHTAFYSYFVLRGSLSRSVSGSSRL